MVEMSDVELYQMLQAENAEVQRLRGILEDLEATLFFLSAVERGLAEGLHVPTGLQKVFDETAPELGKVLLEQGEMFTLLLDRVRRHKVEGAEETTPNVFEELCEVLEAILVNAPDDPFKDELVTLKAKGKDIKWARHFIRQARGTT